MKEDIKVLLNIHYLDESQDNLLDTLISLKSRKLIMALGDDSKEVPKPLEYIVVETVINHYNRLGSEGLASESVEGISRAYTDTANELESYTAAIDKYLNKYHGKFRMI